MADLPHTSTRLSACLTIVGVHQTGDSALPVDLSNAGMLTGLFSNPASIFTAQTAQAAADLALNAAEYATSWTTLGAAMSMKIAQTATPIARRGINASIESFAMLPGPITTTLTIDKAMLYYEDALSAFKFMPGNIALQTTPLIIIENLNVPDSPEIQKRFGSFARKLGTAGGIGISDFGLLQPNIYVGCRFTESRIEYDINSADQMVVHNVTLSVARIINPASEIATQAGRIAGLFGAEGMVQSATAVLASNVAITNKLF